ncbi:DUF3800 domain-containing protein [Pseudorhodobacter turbinis]|uniref:DUF3800 domain-containing protein n=1 Tax=Pseudorhodobacter turbinis TaxID=2500533 RepID=A0A4P8ECW1_9RHOB|nr:DUF3800 domain-containing protein [Pseudorhodobacter turbinis]
MLLFGTGKNHADLRCQKPRSNPMWLLEVFGNFHDDGHSCNAQHRTQWAHCRHSLPRSIARLSVDKSGIDGPGLPFSHPRSCCGAARQSCQSLMTIRHISAKEIEDKIHFRGIICHVWTWLLDETNIGMHFFYLDEADCTGTDIAPGQQPIFVLGGISVRADGWVRTTGEFERVITQYFAPDRVPAGFELHSSELLSPNGEGFFGGHNRTGRLLVSVIACSLVFMPPLVSSIWAGKARPRSGPTQARFL